MLTDPGSHQYRLYTAIHTTEGTDFPVHRLMPLDTLNHFDPLALVDEMGPDIDAGERTGFEVHPHAGLEVFSYVLEGTIEGQLLWPEEREPVSVGKGGTMWIKFGSGGAHYERPPRSVIENGGRCHVVQLWFALPSDAKRIDGVTEACYGAEQNPVWTRDDGKVIVRVLLGEAFGHRAPAKICADASYVHATLLGDASLTLPVPDGHVVMAYVLSGSAQIGHVAAKARQSVLRSLGADADGVPVVAGAEGVQLLFVTGKPLNEPIEQVATFVMNSMDEIGECFEKYGRFLNIEFG